jgi:hypothetical protein
MSCIRSRPELVTIARFSDFPREGLGGMHRIVRLALRGLGQIVKAFE